MVVAQLVERSLPTLEVRGSNSVIGKKICWILIVNCVEIWKDKNKEKESGIGPFLNKPLQQLPQEKDLVSG